MGYTQTVAPTSEPVSLAEAKAHLRVEHDADNLLISGLIAAARETVEAETGRQLVTATWTLKLDEFPTDEEEIVIRHPPLSSVSSITYLDADGASQTFNSSSYQVDTTGVFGRIVLAPDASWPVTESDRINAVTVTFIAGQAVASVPEAAKVAIKFLVGHWYENREAGSESQIHEVPMAAKALIQQLWVGEA